MKIIHIDPDAEGSGGAGYVISTGTISLSAGTMKIQITENLFNQFLIGNI